MVCIKNRFEQEGYAIYRQLEDILVTNTSEEDYEDKVRDVTAFYGDDFNEELLKTQPALFHTNYSTEDHKSINDTIKLLQQTSAAEKSLLSEVIKVARLLLVMPATNAVSERTFSSMRRLKSYLWTTMTQERMNSLIILHTHKGHTDNLN